MSCLFLPGATRQVIFRAEISFYGASILAHHNLIDDFFLNVGDASLPIFWLALHHPPKLPPSDD